MTASPASHLDIYRALAKSNCGRCQLPSCLAFAAAAASGQKNLADCPLLDAATRERLAVSLAGRPEQELYRFVRDLSQLERQIAGLDLAAAAPRLGGIFRDGRLTLKSLGKEFAIDQQGQVHSECHLIPWVKAPLLAYAASPQHQQVTDRWLNFRDLPGCMERGNLFASRCERLLKDLADQHPGLLRDLAELFQGEEAAGFAADTALILCALPHFPLLICWQAPEDDLESSLTILFDECCGGNLPAQMTLSLCIGLVQMFSRIAALHN
ncbi:MAG: DUF3786 domain-containing protein [Candidatus Electronema sp. V4]|uniref:DUF3786 domain-containing protein n=1 Tax=Candidatus Electronema sp. V4 TaxID=3454756 RepID=UPI0040557A43